METDLPRAIQSSWSLGAPQGSVCVGLSCHSNPRAACQSGRWHWWLPSEAPVPLSASLGENSTALLHRWGPRARLVKGLCGLQPCLGLNTSLHETEIIAASKGYCVISRSYFGAMGASPVQVKLI